MKSYNELEEIVFNWLMNKHQKDPSFTFSLRQVASKGAELNYFIGTEKSKYFGTTFWAIHVNYPGSSSDLINLIFEIKDDGYSYRIQFNQTRSPDNNQNKYALKFIQQVKEKLRGFRGFYENDAGNRMEYFHVGDAKAKYIKEDELIKEAEKDLMNLIPIVNEELTKFKQKNPKFIADKIKEDQFSLMVAKLKKRREKYLFLSNGSKNNSEKSIEIPFVKVSKIENSYPLNQILYGPPGTGKTYNTINKALEIIGENIDGKSREEIKEIFSLKVQEGQISFTTFHQSMSYEDFIEGIKPETVDNEVIYDIKPGIFRLFCEQAKTKAISSDNFEQVYKKLLDEIKKNSGKLVLESIVHAKEFTVYVNSKGNLRFHANTEKHYEGVIKKEVIEHYLKTGETLDWPSYVKAVGVYLVSKYHYTKKEQEANKRYVFIIDEINRGNVSQIFGELITLIEEDKRLGNSEALEVILPYSKKPFSVPSNLYIIGTMNTADRSVEALDAALRRRFCFEEMMPIYDLEGLDSGFKEVEILKTINHRIEKLLDKDHQIGHSYFLSVKSKEDLISAFYTKIIPLLQEYFFGDFGKIGLILGSGFVNRKEWNKNSDSFAEFDYESAGEFEEKDVYKIIDYRKTDTAHIVKGIEMSFDRAINLLLKEAIV